MDKHVFVKIEDREEKGVILEELNDTGRISVQLDNGEVVTVDRENVKKYKVEENYETDLNGWKDFSETPFVKKAITYYNPSAGKWQTQNYIVLNNVIVSPMVRRNEETGEFEFALERKTNASTMKNNQYDGQLLEVPKFVVEKDNLSDEEVEEIFEEQCLSKYGEEYFSTRQLEGKHTAISQSFTNQLANFRVVAVDYGKESDLEWYPISSLPSCIEKNGQEPFTSLQTAYALELLYDMYKEQIDSMEKTEFINKSSEGSISIKKIKEISENKYRFGIEDIIYEKNGEKEYDTYATSKDSVQCILTRRDKNGRIQIGLSKQQRSPFIENEKFDEYLYEISAGMLDLDETFEESAVREAREETGYKIKKEDLKHLGGPLIISLATQELSDFYLCEISNEQQDGEQKLDEQENIGKMEWFDLDNLNLEELHAPLPTKYAILKAKQYYKELEKRIDKEAKKEGFEK